jgi:hypothetical protein
MISMNMDDEKCRRIEDIADSGLIQQSASLVGVDSRHVNNDDRNMMVEYRVDSDGD